MSEELQISTYWRNQLRVASVQSTDLQYGETFEYSDGTLGCAQCCNKDRCDEPSHYYRPNCPYCLGTGANRSCFDENGNRIHIKKPTSDEPTTDSSPGEPQAEGGPA